MRITLPTLNGAAWLGESVLALCGDIGRKAPWPLSICIADNGSTDETPAIADRLGRRFPNVSSIHLAQPGRGRALRMGWIGSESDVLCYMDVDLSTDPAHLPELAGAVASGQWDLAVGSRLMQSSQTSRGWRRDRLSRSYNSLLRSAFGVGFSDAQCGFKAISRRVAQSLLPLVEDNHWFFDTELLVIAEAAGCRIHDFPVRWTDHAETSTVKIIPTIGQMLAGIVRLKRRLRNGLVVEARRRWVEACHRDGVEPGPVPPQYRHLL